MFLAVDIGNTGTTFGFFKDNVLIHKKNIHSVKNNEYQKNIIKIIKDISISDCLISSVVEELTDECKTVIEEHTKIKPVLFSSNFDLGMKIKAENPKKIGSDRIINAFASSKLYSKPAITVDIGTALTFDIIDENGDFIGGLIGPGIQTQLNSLGKNTSKLPNLDVFQFDVNTNVINTDTSKAILSGVIRGQAFAIEGLIEACKKEMNANPILIGTGGYIEIISKCMKNQNFDVINPNLTLYGLNLIHNKLHEPAILP